MVLSDNRNLSLKDKSFKYVMVYPFAHLLAWMVRGSACTGTCHARFVTVPDDSECLSRGEISIVCLTFTIGCSAAAGALGARMVKGTAPGSMSAKNGMITTLVGWAVLYVPRRAVVWFSRRVLRDGHRAATVGEVAPRGRVDRRGDVTVV